MTATTSDTSSATSSTMSSAIFSVLGALLHYPDDDLLAALPELRAMVRQSPALAGEARAGVLRFLEYLSERGLLTLQENYVALFDRGRMVSLYLFEHVHGESRDRGQAMIDLRNLYESKGLFLAPGELPDYLPVFLEFLSRQPWREAQSLLEETSRILAALAQRLTARGSHYCLPVSALLALAGEKPASPQFEARDDEDPGADTAQHAALDAAWHDEPVMFGGGAQPCRSDSAAPVKFYENRPAR